MDKKLAGLVVLFVLVLGVFVSTLFFNSTGRTAIRASNVIPSCANSYIFASKVTALVGENVPLVVYLRSEENEAVPNTSVTCQTSLGAVNPISAITEKTGIVNINASSQTPGTATITCSIAQCALAQNVTVQFNNP